MNFENSAQILDEEDEATLALLKQRAKAADEGRMVSSEEVRQRMKKWLTKSFTKKVLRSIKRILPASLIRFRLRKHYIHERRKINNKIRATESPAL
ncbi:MAG TPA: hypothetical protein VNW97_12455 [Candidatus Saccharimonadales bacterium]|nr:hypothetical protein [Candidatus Saccharimonadales bacterium]